MRKAILLLLVGAVALPSCATSRRAEYRENTRDVREERQDVRDAKAYGDRRDVREEREDLRDAKQERAEDLADPM